MSAARMVMNGLVALTWLVSIDTRQAAAQTCTPPPSGVVGWWAGNGSATDAISGVQAQLAGDTTYRTAAVGAGFKFDGVGDLVEIPDSAALKPAQVSVEAWVRFDALDTPPLSATPGLQYIVFKRNSRMANFEGYALRKERVSGIDRFVFSALNSLGFGAAVQSTTPVVVGQFYHVVASYDGTTLRLYVNGVLEGQATPAIALDYGTRPVFLGSSGESFWDGKLNGIVDEATIYNRALSAGEVLQLHAAGAGGKCAVQTNVAPSILREPVDVTLLPGESTTLTVAATGSGPLAFQWYGGTRGDTTSPIGGATTPSVTTPAVMAATRYWVRVSNLVGATDSATATVTPLPTIGPPADLYVKAASGNTVTLAWRPTPGQQPVTGHVLEGGLTGNATPLAIVETGSTAPSFTINVPNGSFWVRMRARSGNGLSSPSAEIPICYNAGCVPPPPSPVLGLANGSALSLGWRTPLEAGPPTRLTLQVTGALATSLNLPGTAESFTFPSVPAGTYTFAILSCNAAGCSAPSGPVTLTFPGTCPGPPATPIGFSAGKSGGTLVLDWGLPPDGSPASVYVLNVSGAFTGTVPFATRGFSGAVPAGSYTFTLAAANACGVSAPTAPVTISVP